MTTSQQMNHDWPEMPRKIAKALSAKSVVLIVSFEDGTEAITSHGANHAGLIATLANGMYMTIDDHKRAVLAGMAGEAAQATAAALEEENQ